MFGGFQFDGFIFGVVVGVVLREVLRLFTNDAYIHIKEKLERYRRRRKMSEFEKRTDDLFGATQSLDIDDVISEEDNNTRRIDVKSGQTINCYFSTDEGYASKGILLDPDGNWCFSTQFETEKVRSHTAEHTGNYTIFIATKGVASLKVNIN